MLKFYVIGFTLALSSCLNNDNSVSKIAVDTNQAKRIGAKQIGNTFPIEDLYIIPSDEQGWGADLRLSYTESLATERGILYKVNSIYKGETIGFDVIVPKAGFTTLTIKSAGGNSNNFIHALSKLYNQKVPNSAQFVDLINADCVNIGEYLDGLHKQNDRNYISTKAQYKLFFQGPNVDDYAELYLNVNKKEHWIEIEEKDEEYRAIIIRLLRKK